MQLLFCLSNAKVKRLELEVAIRNHNPKVFAGGDPLKSGKGLSFDLLSLRRDNPTRVFVDNSLCLSACQFGYDDAFALTHHELVGFDLFQQGCDQFANGPEITLRTYGTVWREVVCISCQKIQHLIRVELLNQGAKEFLSGKRRG